MTQVYKGGKATATPQIRVDYYHRKALKDMAEKMIFSKMADSEQMPQHHGKEFKLFYYVPLLDEKNKTDQGIDAAGAKRLPGSFSVTFPFNGVILAQAEVAAAVTAINDNVSSKDGTASVAIAKAGAANSGGSAGQNKLVLTTNTVQFATEAKADAAITAAKSGVKLENRGALYGGSRDIGVVTGNMPELQEDSERVNRVGFTRLERSGTIQEHGFFHEWVKDFHTFDTDSKLYAHESREMLKGANEVYEDLLQADLLNAADVKVYPGTAGSIREITGKDGGATLLELSDLQKMSDTLDENRTPKATNMITGSVNIDTMTVSDSRFAYIGTELKTMISNWDDFVPVRKYGHAGKIMYGEIGALPSAYLRIIQVQRKMMKWAGAGALEGTNGGYKVTGGRYDVAPILVVGDKSFATIGLQGMPSGKNAKFQIIVKHASPENADRTDPYGKYGFSSICFWYGFIKLRGERIAVAYSPIPK